VLAVVAAAGTVLATTGTAAAEPAPSLVAPDHAAIARAADEMAARHSLRNTAAVRAKMAAAPTDELRFGDLTGDGRADLAAVDSAGVLWVYPGKQYEWDGVGTRSTTLFGARIQVGRGWGAFTSLVRHGDFDGDGKQDILARDSQGRLLFYAGTGSTTGMFKAGIVAGTGWGSMLSIIGSGDFDFDGRDDVIGQNSAGELRLYPGTGDGAAPFRGKGVVVGTGWRGNLLTSIGDWTGDGITELIFRHQSGAVYQYDSRPGVLPIGKRWDVLPAPEGFGVQNFIGMGNLTSDSDYFPVPDLLWQMTDGTLRMSAPDTTAESLEISKGWSSYRLF
jgi:hypothetical protein